MKIKLKNRIKLFFIKLIAFKLKKQNFKIDVNHLNKVLIRINDPIGDAILTTPVYRELKKINSQIQIDLILSKRNDLLFNKNPHIHRKFITHKGNLKFLELLYMRKQKYDLVIDLYGKISFIFFLQLRFINAKYNIANATSVADIKKYKTSTKDFNFFDFVFGLNLDKHHADRYLEFFKIFNFKITNKSYELYREPDSLKKYNDFFREKNYYVGINYKGSNKGNSFTVSTTIELGHSLVEIFPNITFILLSEPKSMEEAKNICTEINSPNFLLTPATHSLNDFISLISFLDTIITTGSSAMHIASSFEKNIIAVYPNIQYYYTFEPKTQGICKIIHTISQKNTSVINTKAIVQALDEILKERD